MENVTFLFCSFLRLYTTLVLVYNLYKRGKTICLYKLMFLKLNSISKVLLKFLGPNVLWYQNCHKMILEYFLCVVWIKEHDNAYKHSMYVLRVGSEITFFKDTHSLKNICERIHMLLWFLYSLKVKSSAQFCFS